MLFSLNSGEQMNWSVELAGVIMGRLAVFIPANYDSLIIPDTVFNNIKTLTRHLCSFFGGWLPVS